MKTGQAQAATNRMVEVPIPQANTARQRNGLIGGLRFMMNEGARRLPNPITMGERTINRIAQIGSSISNALGNITARFSPSQSTQPTTDQHGRDSYHEPFFEETVFVDDETSSTGAESADSMQTNAGGYLESWSDPGRD
ncbi:hypothetical protein [Yoonia sp. BS5-3]|uniref:Uncharacterized protein n=1 Tax=Yoonia phaeophyticola TaxID=3137369 RepID=A0ABZ2V292_9RHOB